MFDEDLTLHAQVLLLAYETAGCTLVTAESCTGGLIAACLTAIAGSSEVLERGFVTYSNAAKEECLGVPAETLARHGAVSAETAEAMAAGALAHSRADVALSVTGIAGPGGATPEKPVGLVYFGLCRRGAAPRHRRWVFPGDRTAVRRAALEVALTLALEALPPVDSPVGPTGG